MGALGAMRRPSSPCARLFRSARPCLLPLWNVLGASRSKRTSPSTALPPPRRSVLFRAEICVISSLSEDYCHVVTPPEVWKVELRTRLYLGHFAEYHYVSTRPI